MENSQRCYILKINFKSIHIEIYFTEKYRQIDSII